MKEKLNSLQVLKLIYGLFILVITMNFEFRGFVNKQLNITTRSILSAHLQKNNIILK